MTLLEYDALAQRTSNPNLTKTEHIHNGVLGLAGESGECADLLKKRYYQDGRSIRADLFDELGDVLWYVVEAAHGLGFTLEQVAEHNIDKLKKRYPEGFDPERSLHRAEAPAEGEKEATPHEDADYPYPF